MKLILSQVRPTDGDIEGAFRHVAMLFDLARAVGADVVLLPELFWPGYNRPDLHEELAQPLDGPWVRQLQAMARGAGCALVTGMAERAGADLYNTALAIGPGGEILARYRKIQLFGPMERAVFRPGDDLPPVFALGGRKVGLLICYDIEFAGHAAGLAARGAEAILVPTANPVGFEHVQDTLVAARAVENAITVAYANYCGTEAGLAFGGGSVVVGADGRVLARAGTREAMLIVDLPARADYPQEILSTQRQDYQAL